MAKVYPQEQPSCSSSSSDMISNERETYTVWMKSLVCHTNGCTAYDSKGQLVYRIDNYDDKSSNEVHLMDVTGRVLCTIHRKRFQVFGRWDGYRCCSNSTDKEVPWFQVKKHCRLVMGDLACQITVGSADKYWIVRSASAPKTAFKIVNTDGDVVAEVKPKQSSSGVALGNDVFTLVVEPGVDCTLVMALLTVNGLINHKL